jgi:3-deoxy-D-manno-octulosonic-acid transferase
MILFFYRFILYLLTPFLKLWIYYRLLRKKEHPTRFRERLGKSRLKRPDGLLFWFHGASNGECLSFLSLIKRYQTKYPNAHFLITSQTLTSCELLQSRLPKHSFHQFLPLDHPCFVKRFLNHWSPDYIFWTESELWPNLIFKASERTPLILLNGRFSKKSFEWWKKIPDATKSLLNCFSLIFAGSQKDQERFQFFNHPHVHFLGNLKFAGRPLEANPSKVRELKSALKNRPIWTATCTHPGEEGFILKAHTVLKKSLKNVITILVPRHPHRADKLRQEWESKGFKVSQRSLNEPIRANTDILLFDTTGELGLIYRVCPITLVCGSLIEGIGGHNPLESANLKSAICTGPYIKNNQEIYAIFQKEQACKMIQNPKDIARTILPLLENTKERNALIKKSFTLANDQHHILDKIIQSIASSGVFHNEGA